MLRQTFLAREIKLSQDYLKNIISILYLYVYYNIIYLSWNVILIIAVF